MSSSFERREVEPYGKTGPYGEVLWYFLRELKGRFVEGVAKRIIEQHETTELAGKEVRRLVEPRIDRARRKLKQGKSVWIKRLINHWPATAESNDRQEQASLAEIRFASLSSYFSLCKSHVQQQEETDAWIQKVIAAIVWPYYFVRFDNPEGERQIVTWMPNTNLLAMPVDEGILNHPGQLLYPTLYPLFSRGEGSPERRLLLENLSQWVDLGFSTVSSTGIGRDIGHVQPFVNGEPSVFLHNVLDDSHQRARFSDLFYLNRCAYRWYERQTPPDNSTVIGAVFWCSPIKDILLDLAELGQHEMPPDDVCVDDDVTESDASFRLGSRVAFLRQQTEEAWKRSRGSIIGASLRRRYQSTWDELIVRQQEHVIRDKDDFLGYIQHDIKNLFRSVRSSDDHKSMICVHVCAQLVLRLAKVLLFPHSTDDDEHFVKWKAILREYTLEEGLEFADALVSLCYRESEKRLSPTCDFSAIEEKSANVVLAGVMLEVIRNMGRHAFLADPEVPGQASLIVEAAGTNEIVVIGNSRPHHLEKLVDLYNGLAGLSTNAPMKGVRVLLRLIESLSPRGKPYATWRFNRLNTEFGEEFETIADENGLWHIEVPARLASVLYSGRHKQSDLNVLGSVTFETARLTDAIRHQ